MGIRMDRIRPPGEQFRWIQPNRGRPIAWSAIDRLRVPIRRGSIVRSLGFSPFLERMGHDPGDSVRNQQASRRSSPCHRFVRMWFGVGFWQSAEIMSRDPIGRGVTLEMVINAHQTPSRAAPKKIFVQRLDNCKREPYPVLLQLVQMVNDVRLPH